MTQADRDRLLTLKKAKESQEETDHTLGSGELTEPRPTEASGSRVCSCPAQFSTGSLGYLG
jgi:hypothetical protein